MNRYDIVEKIARHLCEADGHDPKIIGVAGNHYRENYVRTAWNMIPLLVEAWDEGAETAWNRSTPEVNGDKYHWRRTGEPHNPYRGKTNNEC